MSYLYILDKDEFSQLDLTDEYLQVEEMSDGPYIDSHLLRIVSQEDLEVDKENCYSPLVMKAFSQAYGPELYKLQTNYLAKKLNIKYVNANVEKSKDTLIISFYTRTLPLYVKNKERDALLEALQLFRPHHYYYGQDANYLEERNIKFYINEGIYYGDNKLEKSLPEASFDRNQFLLMSERMPRHKLLKQDKLSLLEVLHNNPLLNNINHYNQLLANNEIIFTDTSDLQKQADNYYGKADKNKKTIFKDLEEALCFYLKYRISGEPAVLVSEAKQWIIFYKQDISTEIDCRQVLIDKLAPYGLEDKNLTLAQLCNIFIVKEQMIISDNNKKLYLDKDGDNLPLSVVMSHGQHHHLYYDNGIIKGLALNTNKPVLLPEIVNFEFYQINNKDQVEVYVIYNKKERQICERFYLPSKYTDIIEKKLRIIFSLGMMLTPYHITKYQKEGKLDIKNIFFPDWLCTENKDLLKYLLQL